MNEGRRAVIKALQKHAKSSSPLLFALSALGGLTLIVCCGLWSLNLADAALSADKSYASSPLWWLSILSVFTAIALFGLWIGVLPTSNLTIDEMVNPVEAANARGTAIVVVHGMGVQDRYSMLTTFSDGLRTFARDYHVQDVRPGSGPVNCRTLIARDVENGQLTTFDVHEVFWGNVFNGVTNWRSALLFSLGTMKTSATTLASRVWRKRAVELIQIGLAGTVFLGIMVLIFGGFRLSVLRVDAIQHPVLTNSDHYFAGFTLSIPGVDSVQTQYRKLGLSATRKYGATIGNSREQLDQGQRLQEFKTFVDRSFRTTYDDAVHSLQGQSVPLLPPWERMWSGLKAFGPSRLIFGVVYTYAFYLTISVFFRATWCAIWSFFGDIRERKRDREAYGPKEILTLGDSAKAQVKERNDRLRQDRLRGLHSLFYPGIAGYTMYLLLDPYLDVLVVHFLFCAALLLVTLRSVAYWFDNFMGDVQIYATSDENSRFFAKREEATALVAKELDRIIQLVGPEGPKYHRIIVVAHSLGSAVTVNALRRLSGYTSVGTEHKSLPTIWAFITIGSPLRKFRQLFNAKRFKQGYGQHNQHADEQIFLGPVSEGESGSSRIPWFNFAYSFDVFADRLSRLNRSGAKQQGIDEDSSGYPVERRHDLMMHRWAVWSHSDYWLDDRFIDPLIDIARSDNPRMLDIIEKPGETVPISRS